MVPLGGGKVLKLFSITLHTREMSTIKLRILTMTEKELISKVRKIEILNHCSTGSLHWGSNEGRKLIEFKCGHSLSGHTSHCSGRDHKKGKRRTMQNLPGGGWGLGVGGTIVVNSRWQIRRWRMEGRKRWLANHKGAYPPLLSDANFARFLSYSDTGCRWNLWDCSSLGSFLQSSLLK